MNDCISGELWCSHHSTFCQTNIALLVCFVEQTRLGPDYKDSFDVHEAKLYAGEHSELFDGYLVKHITVHLNCKAWQNQLCLNLAASTSGSKNRKAIVEGHRVSTKNIQDVIKSLGGVNLVFMLVRLLLWISTILFLSSRRFVC